MDLVISETLTIPEGELGWRFSRASGPGGQHVNKTDSRVELFWNVRDSSVLNEDQRSRLLAKLERRLVSGTLTVTASEQRSQLRNREVAVDKISAIIREALASDPSPRRATKPTRGSVRRHFAAKTRRSETKKLRQRPRGE